LATNWNKIRNEYINGNISYQKLAEKHEVNYNTLQDKARKEKWFAKKKAQQEKITEKTLQKSAEKLAEAEANRLLKISNAADKLLEKIELATEQLDLYLEKTKVKTPVKVKDKKTGETLNAFQENETFNVAQKNRIDRAGLKQIASALKDLKDIQFTADEDKPQESPNINITVVAATPDDMEDEE
jgi:hypothetical protein